MSEFMQDIQGLCSKLLNNLPNEWDKEDLQSRAWYIAHHPYVLNTDLQQAELDRLTAENERLKTALAGRTYFHSDAEVERQNRVMLSALEQIADDSYSDDYDKGYVLRECESIAREATKEVQV